jgi:dTDP-4-dehydrorhamnose reductase
MLDNTLEHGCRLVHLSSDLVFSGIGSGNHRENDAVDPVTVYGKTMVQAEDLILGRDPAAAILRISLPMGPSFNKHAGAIDWIQSRFRNQRPATLYFDEVRSCTYCDDLNPVFEHFLGSDARGIYHLGSPRPIALYEIAQVVNRVGGYDPHLLKGCPRKEAGPMPPRAGNVSMCSDKLATLIGRNPFRAWPLGDDLLPTHRRWHFDRLPHEQGSLERIAERLYHYV